MGLLSWLRGSSAPQRALAPSHGALRTKSVPAQAVDARGDGYMAVVGESFYGAGFAAVTGDVPGDHELELALVRDAQNVHDRNCIAVLTLDGVQLGNLSRENAKRFAAGLDSYGGAALVNGRLRRSPEHRNWNVVLRVDYDVLQNL